LAACTAISPPSARALSICPASSRGVKVNEAYKKLGMLGTGEQKYMPWMQATYLMAATSRPCNILPAGTISTPSPTTS